MHHPKYGVLFDFHTMASCPDVGAAFDAERTADQIKKCGIDFVVIHARCNQGFAYYDTKLGIRHPALTCDLFGEFVTACRKRDIATSAYLNAGLSHAEGLAHRDWLTVSPKGETYRPPYDFPEFMTMCYNTAYAEHVLAMIDELFQYPVTGFFLDCLMPHECIGSECVREMRQAKMDIPQFAEFSRNRFVKRIAEKIRSQRPDSMLFFNCVPFAVQRPYATYFEFECLPTGGWGYESLMLNSRYLRTLGLPVVNMTGRFHESWGDFGGIRPRASLLYDCVTGFANGMDAVNVGDHLHPRGKLSSPVFDLLGSVYSELQQLDDYTDGARPLVDITLMVPADTHDNSLESVPSIRSAQGFARMLAELKTQFEVIHPDQNFEGSRVLILADNIRFDDVLASRVEQFLQSGGRVIASGSSGLKLASDDFSLQLFWPGVCRGACQHNPGYFRTCQPVSGVPDMPVTLYDGGMRITARPAVERVAGIVAPYCNRGYDLEYSQLYIPPDIEDGSDFLLMNRQVAHFSHKIGFTYYKHAQPAMRSMLGYVLEKFLPSPLLKVDGFPSFGRATVLRQKNRYLVWLTAFVPERRGEKMDIVEEGVTVKNIQITLQTKPLEMIRKVFSARDKRSFSWSNSEGLVQSHIPEFTGYECIVFEL